ncbi:MAG: preprotein translocase subunit SecG [Planctomycetota bacterium]|jgi:preprotein translocase subunit SecG
MSIWFLLLTIFFIIVAVVMILIILVQRTQGGGLAGAFGGAGGAGAETVFGGRVGDALTWATVVAFLVYLGLAIALNKVPSKPLPPPPVTPAAQIGSNPESVPPATPPESGAPGGGADFSLPQPGDSGTLPPIPSGTGGTGDGGASE